MYHLQYQYKSTNVFAITAFDQLLYAQHAYICNHNKYSPNVTMSLPGTLLWMGVPDPVHDMTSRAVQKRSGPKNLHITQPED